MATFDARRENTVTLPKVRVVFESEGADQLWVASTQVLGKMTTFGPATGTIFRHVALTNDGPLLSSISPPLLAIEIRTRPMCYRDSNPSYGQSQPWPLYLSAEGPATASRWGLRKVPLGPRARICEERPRRRGRQRGGGRAKSSYVIRVCGGVSSGGEAGAASQLPTKSISCTHGGGHQ